MVSACAPRAAPVAAQVRKERRGPCIEVAPSWVLDDEGSALGAAGSSNLTPSGTSGGHGSEDRQREAQLAIPGHPAKLDYARATFVLGSSSLTTTGFTRSPCPFDAGVST